MKRLSYFQLFFLVFSLSFLTWGTLKERIEEGTIASPALNSPKLVKTYDGPELPESVVGQIVYDHKAPGLLIKAIDGKYYREILDAVGFDFSENNLRGYALLPGEHIIKVVGLGDIGRRVSIVGEWSFELLIESGHKYILSYRIGKIIKGTQWHYVDVFFKDTRNKEIIKPKKTVIN